MALARSGDATIAYVADQDEDQLLTMVLGRGDTLATTPLQGSPAEVLVLADGRVAVTLRDKNAIEVLEPDASSERPLASRCVVATPAEPFGLAATDDDATLLVTSAWAKKVTALDATTLATRFDADVAREPRSIVVDGDRAFVSHVVGAKMSVVDLEGDKHEVRTIDLRVKNAVFTNGAGSSKTREGCQGFALAKSVEVDDKPEITVEKPLPEAKPIAPPAPKPRSASRRVLAPMVTVDPGEATVRTRGYGQGSFRVAAEVPIVSVVDADAERSMTRTLIADGGQHSHECILPRAAATTKDGGLLVTCLGSNTLVEMDARAVDPARVERRRWKVPEGPLGVAVDEKSERAVVWSQFDRALTVVDLTTGDIAGSAVSVAPQPKLDLLAAWGRKVFHKTDDARISNDGRACASCHPDGREDALTWSTPEGPRQTIMLAGRVASSAPYGWLGLHADLRDHIKTTLERLGGSGISDDRGGSDLDALVAWLERMPAPSTDGAAVDNAKHALIARGRELFFDERQGCSGCHLGGSGTDATKHDVSSRIFADTEGLFDTPSLRFVGGTAPYFHDGRYASLEELLGGSDGKMGHTLELSRRDVGAMKAYLESL